MACSEKSLAHILQTIILAISILLSTNTYGQKPKLDSTVFESWPTLIGITQVSGDGKFIAYTESHKSLGQLSYIIKSIDGSWEKRFQNIKLFQFTLSSKFITIYNTGDSIIILKLGGKEHSIITNVTSCEVLKDHDHEYLAYQQAGISKNFFLLDFESFKTWVYPNIEAISYSENNATIILKRNMLGKESLSWLNLNNKKESKFWEGVKVSDITIDPKGNQIAFITEDGIKTIWNYKKNTSKCINLLSNDSINGILKYNNSTDLLFIKLAGRINENEAESPLVDIWRYSDIDLSNPSGRVKFPKSYIASLEIKSSKLVILQGDNEKLTLFDKSIYDYALLTLSKGDQRELFWNNKVVSQNFIINCRTGDRIPTEIEYIWGISPDGNYFLGTDSLQNKLLSLNLLNGITRNLLDKVPDIYKENNNLPTTIVWFSAWLPNKKSILIHDKYDIWEVKLNGDKVPYCLTGKQGRNNKIQFSIINIHSNSIIINDESILGSAFEEKTKRNCIFMLNPKAPPKIKSLALEDVFTYDDNNTDYTSFTPIKADKSNLWVVRRETAMKSPNLYYTTDFKNYKEISSIYPELNYNWLTSELVNYYTSLNDTYQGIIYKPQNFDSTKKYPVIIHFYEQKSNQLNVYQKPIATGDNLNIPWYVSRGYIVFTPDVKYSEGDPAKSGYKQIIAAAQFISKKSWVDSSKIGIQGHSYAAYMINYVVSHSKIFAAAISSDGVSNIVSNYLQTYKGRGFQYFYERGQGNLIKNMWEAKNLYTESSPVLEAENVTTPLLLVHGKKDEIVKVDQSVSFFLALRRLKKEVWLLQYNNEPHVIMKDRARIDYTKRMDQFFDYFLLGKDCPKWMLGVGGN
ncbi:prolyl oligopeptidase family serine peptidase [Chitinophaga sp. MM2321]|uniref:alpha/beta hydrolase family protein n=1 Tax=Chitinophaga sp. MM2321 TaxID=3137178 RepID=UPI0032D59AC9